MRDATQFSERHNLAAQFELSTYLCRERVEGESLDGVDGERVVGVDVCEAAGD